MKVYVQGRRRSRMNIDSVFRGFPAGDLTNQLHTPGLRAQDVFAIGTALEASRRFCVHS